MKSILKFSLVAVVAVALVLFVLGTFAPQVMAQGLMPWGRMGRGPMSGMTGTMPYGMTGMVPDEVRRGMGGGRGGMTGMGMGGQEHSLIAVAAKTLAMSESDLLAELNKNQSIAAVAQAKNVDLIKIIDAFIAPHVAQMSGHMSKEQVDTMVGTMKAQLAIHLNEQFTPSNGSMFMDNNHDGVCDTMEGDQFNHPTMPMNGRGMWNR